MAQKTTETDEIKSLTINGVEYAKYSFGFKNKPEMANCLFLKVVKSIVPKNESLSEVMIKPKENPLHLGL